MPKVVAFRYKKNVKAKLQRKAYTTKGVVFLSLLLNALTAIYFIVNNLL